MMVPTKISRCLLGISIVIMTETRIFSDAADLSMNTEGAAEGLNPLIVGGKTARVFQWPWQAALSTCKNNTCNIICGGALISPQYVITAAHCVTTPKTVNPISLDFVKIYLGKHHRDESKDDSSVQNMKATDFHIHQNYSITSYDSDIALIKLSTPANIAKNVDIVNLPPPDGSNNLVPDKRGYVSGWGITSNGSPSDILQFAKLPVVSNDNCEKAYNEKFKFKITNNMFCAGFETGLVDSCDGDSGGPMVFNKGGNWILEGIVSWGSPYGCGFPRQYGVYVRVDRFVSWIKSFIDEH